jgi:hypothetical protein
MNNTSLWTPLVRKVAGVIRVMPLWKPQTLGQERLDFLYANAGTGSMITLRPGVAFCFRKFHPLIADLVRGVWVRYVRQQNLKIVGEITDPVRHRSHRLISGSSGALGHSAGPVFLLPWCTPTRQHAR